MGHSRWALGAYQSGVPSIDLEAEEAETVREGIASLHALLSERYEREGRALFEQVDLVVMAELAIVVDVSPRLRAVAKRRLHMLPRDEILRAVDEAAEITYHVHGRAFPVLRAGTLQRLALLAHRLLAVRDEVEESRHLIAVEQPPFVEYIAVGVHDAAPLQRHGEIKLAVEVAFDDILALLRDALRLLRVRSLQLACWVGSVEPLEPSVAQLAALERDTLLGGAEIDDRGRSSVVFAAVREAADQQHLPHLLVWESADQQQVWESRALPQRCARAPCICG